MELLIIYILTILGSFAGDVLLTSKLIKDAANEGYLIDVNRLKEVNNKINDEHYNSLIKLIPIVNIIVSLKNMVDYNNARPYILTELSIFDMLKEMTDEERKEYSRKPTALRAIRIDVDRELRLKDPSVSVLNVYNNTGKIWYEKENHDYTILKVTGTAKDISRVTQIDLIEDNYKRLVDDGIKYYGDPLKFLLETKNCKNYNELENKINEQKMLQEELFKQAKAQLESLKTNTHSKEEVFEEQAKEEVKTLKRKL